MHRLVVPLVLLFAPHTAHTCTGEVPSTAEQIARAPDVFAWFDQAGAVVEGKVTAAPGFSVEGHGLAGTIDLAISKVLKGKPGKKLSYHQEARACSGTNVGTVELVFLDAHGKPIGIAGTSVESALEAWRGAGTDADKRAVLNRLAKSSDPAIAGAAAKRLAALH